ncbi:hypothetical protein ACFX12_037688 [Malus domestica]
MIKAQALSDLTERPNDTPKATENTLATPALPGGDVWHLHINITSNYKGSGASMVLITPRRFDAQACNHSRLQIIQQRIRVLSPTYRYQNGKRAVKKLAIHSDS